MQKVMIVDDHQIVIDGYKLFFLGNKEYKVIAEANNAEQLFEVLEHTFPNIIILDIELPTLSGIEITEILTEKHPNIKVILLSGNLHKDENITKAINAGAMGIISKSTKKDSLFKALDKVSSGDEYYSNCITDFLLKQYIKKSEIKNSYTAEKNIKLTDREIELIKCFANGKSYKEIAAKLNISTRTVESHKVNILKKLKLYNIIDIVKFAIKNNYIEI